MNYCCFNWLLYCVVTVLQHTPQTSVRSFRLRSLNVHCRIAVYHRLLHLLHNIYKL